MELDELANKFEIEGHWVKGHAGHPENERAGQLATEAAELATIQWCHHTF